MPRVLLAVTLIAGGAQPEAPAVAIENARVVVGDGRVLDRATIVVVGDRITSVGRDAVTPRDARRIDAAGRTALPGLIDTHVHPTMEGLFAQPRSDEEMIGFVETGVPERLRSLLEAGITSVMSPGEFWPFARRALDRLESGELAGPRFRTAGPLFTSPGGHPAASFCGFLDSGGDNPWCRSHLTVEVDDPDEARAAVHRLADQGVDLIKLIYDGEGDPRVTELPAALVGEIVAAAHERELRAYGHIMEAGKAMIAIRAGLDGLVHLPGVSSGPEELDDLVELMRTESVAASTTLTIFDDFGDIAAAAGDEETPAAMRALLTGMRDLLLRLAATGSGLIAVGTDSPHLDPVDAYHRELALLQEAGLTPAQIVEAATSAAASYMGRDDQVGTLEVGKLSDLVLVSGDPLSDLGTLREPDLVMKGGEIVVSRLP